MTKEMLKLFDRLVTEYDRYIFSLCKRFVGNHHDAEDLKQAVYIALMLKIDEVAEHPEPKRWLYRTTYNKAMDYWEKNTRKNANEDAGCSVTELSATDSYDFFAEMLPKWMDDLERQMFTLRFKHGLDMREISDIVGISHLVCRSRISRLIAKIRKDETFLDLL